MVSKPGEPLPIRDESAIELSLPFTFSMCGTRYHEVFVNSNGTLSFGSPVIDFSESVPEFLAGPPQIAGLWDDLDAGAGGTVFFTEEHGDITVHFGGVPEFNGGAGIGSNTFAITLKRFFDQITLSYGSMTALDGLAGVSCGGAITSGFETPSDLSALADNFRINLLFQPAVFERFTAPTPTSPGSPNDLDNLTLRFTPTTDYSDRLGGAERQARESTADHAAVQLDSDQALHRDRERGRRRLLQVRRTGGRRAGRGDSLEPDGHRAGAVQPRDGPDDRLRRR